MASNDRTTLGSTAEKKPMSTIDEKLKPVGFVRIHRSLLVNIAMAEEIQPRHTGEYWLRVKGGNQYTVTCTFKKHLRLLAQFWVCICDFGAQ